MKKFFVNIRKKYNSLDVYSRGIIILFFIILVIRIALGIIHHPAGDSCWHIEVAEFFGKYKKMSLFEPVGRELFTQPPLFHIIGGLLYSIFSIFSQEAGEMSIKLINPILGSVSVLLIFLIAKKLFNSKIGFYSALIFSFTPINIYFGYMSFVDETVAFFSILSILFILYNNILLSSIFAGLAMLTKINGTFILVPVIYIIWFINKSKKTRKFFHIFVLLFTAFIINFPWYLRNYIAIHNPVWPFLNFIFKSPYVSSDGGSQILFSNLTFLKKAATTLYLTYFGIPGGEIEQLSFFNIPFIELLFIIWLFGTILFCIPLIIGLIKLRDKKKAGLLIIWFGSFILLILLKMITYNPVAHSRHILPATPVIAIISATGLIHIFKKNKIKIIAIMLLSFCIVGFVGVEFTKAIYSSIAWNRYSNDFEWIKNNIPQEKIIFAPGQCFSYNFDRYTSQLWHDKSEWKKLGEGKAREKNISYLWVNQEFTLDPMSILPDDIFNNIKNSSLYELVYNNPETKTMIFKVK